MEYYIVRETYAMGAGDLTGHSDYIYFDKDRAQAALDKAQKEWEPVNQYSPLDGHTFELIKMEIQETQRPLPSPRPELLQRAKEHVAYINSPEYKAEMEAEEARMKERKKAIREAAMKEFDDLYKEIKSVYPNAVLLDPVDKKADKEIRIQGPDKDYCCIFCKYDGYSFSQAYVHLQYRDIDHSLIDDGERVVDLSQKTTILNFVSDFMEGVYISDDEYDDYEEDDE